MRGKSASSFAQLLRKIKKHAAREVTYTAVGSGACDSNVDREEMIIVAK